MHKKIAMVILAAGASTRMKAIKQLLPWKNTTLLGNIIEQGLLTEADTIFVVLGANKEKIIPTIKDYSVTIIENEEWQLGLGKSIACATAFLDTFSTKFDGILVALADQPLLDTAHYNKLIHLFIEGKYGIVATQQGKNGNVPAIFSRYYFSQLTSLNEDIGAKNIINQNRDNLLLVDVNDAAVDVDIKESYTNLYENYGR